MEIIIMDYIGSFFGYSAQIPQYQQPTSSDASPSEGIDDFVMIEEEAPPSVVMQQSVADIRILDEYDSSIHEVIDRASWPFHQKRQVADFLIDKYPGLRVGKVLGKGAFSEAQLISYLNKEGKQETQVLKLSEFHETRKQGVGEVCFDLTDSRVGGEWFALLLEGDHVIQGEEALYYDQNTGEFGIVDRKTVQEILSDPEKRKGMRWTLVGSVSEYVEGARTLSEVIQEKKATIGAMDLSRVQKIARGVLQGVSEMHQQLGPGKAIAHRDIKPDNILVTEGDEVKVFDYGMCKEMSPERKRHSGVGTPYYMAPELFRDEDSSALVDSYAIGVTVFELAVGEAPYTSKDLFGIYSEKTSDTQIADHAHLQGEHLSGVRGLVRDLTNPDQEQRLSVEEGLKHKFFDQ